jgi:hypothetical protein
LRRKANMHRRGPLGRWKEFLALPERLELPTCRYLAFRP